MRPFLLLACAAACQGPAADHLNDRLVRPVHGAERIVKDELAPAEVGKRVRHIASQSVVLFGDPAKPVTATKAAVHAIPGELARIGTIERDTGELASRELKRLRPPPGWIYEEFARVGKLGQDPMGRMTTMLQLDRRMLGEPRDRQHRVDPSDTGPEPSWSERLVRRIFP